MFSGLPRKQTFWCCEYTPQAMLAELGSQAGVGLQHVDDGGVAVRGGA